MKKLKYVYHVAYFYKKGNEVGNGSVTLYRANKIDSEEEIKSVAEFIKEENNNDSVGVTSFILLNKRGK